MPFESPASIMYDTTGTPIPLSGSTIVPVGTSYIPVGGVTLAGTASMMAVDPSGSIYATHADVSGAFRYNTSRLTHLGALDISTGKLQSLRATTDGLLLISAQAGVTTVTGSVALSQTATVTGSVALSQTATIRDETTSTATFTSVSASTTINTTLLAANANRRAATVFNDSLKVLYLKLGGGAEDRYFTVRMAAQSYYEIPGWWAGIVTGVWTGATGSAKVTELSF